MKLLACSDQKEEVSVSGNQNENGKRVRGGDETRLPTDHQSNGERGPSRDPSSCIECVAAALMSPTLQCLYISLICFYWLFSFYFLSYISD